MRAVPHCALPVSTTETRTTAIAGPIEEARTSRFGQLQTAGLGPVFVVVVVAAVTQQVTAGARAYFRVPILVKAHTRGAKRFVVLGRQRQQWSAGEEISASGGAIGKVWVDPLRHRAGRGTDDEKSREGGPGFSEHGFDYSNRDVCCPG